MTQTQNEVRVRWSNGLVTAAPTWQALLDKLRLIQWHRWTEEEFRQVLGKRAMRWSGTDIDIYADAEDLFREMQRARMVEIVNDTNEYEEV